MPRGWRRLRPTCRLRWLDITLDEQANRDAEGTISAPASAVAVHVIPTNEELVMARAAQAFFARRA